MMHPLTILEARSLKSRCQQGWLPLGAVKACLCLSPSFCRFIILVSLRLSLHTTFTLCLLCVYVSTSVPLPQKSLAIVLGYTQIIQDDLKILNYVYKDPLLPQTRSTFRGSHRHTFWGLRAIISPP